MVLDWRVPLAPAGGLFSLVKQRELKAVVHKDASVPERHGAAASLWAGFLQLDDRQWNSSEISGRSLWGHAVPADLPLGAGCHTETLSERSKQPSLCVLGDFYSSLRISGSAMYENVIDKSAEEEREPETVWRCCEYPVKLFQWWYLSSAALAYHTLTKSSPCTLPTCRSCEIRRRLFVSKAAICEGGFCVPSSSLVFFFFSRDKWK